MRKLTEIDLTDRSPELPELSDFKPTHCEPPAESKLQVSRAASRLLISVTKQPPKPEWKDFLSDHQKLRKLKMEQPLLMTDHQKDMRRFLPRRSLGIEDIDFPLEDLDEENDEGLRRPSRVRGMCAEWKKKIANEKLQTTRDTLQLLHHTLRDTWTEADRDELLREHLRFKKVQIPATQLTIADKPAETNGGAAVTSSDARRSTLRALHAVFTSAETALDIRSREPYLFTH